MVNFSVFNELSLPFENELDIENEFIVFFILLKNLENKQFFTIIFDITL